MLTTDGHQGPKIGEGEKLDLAANGSSSRCRENRLLLLNLMPSAPPAVPVSTLVETSSLDLLLQTRQYSQVLGSPYIAGLGGPMSAQRGVSGCLLTCPLLLGLFSCLYLRWGLAEL